MDITILVPILVFTAGVYFLIKLKAFFICHPIKTLRAGSGMFSGKDSFSSLMLALAGTLGVGNIFGVATAIIIGGAGSVFWLMLSALFASVIKYSEVLLAQDTGGGMTEVIKATFCRRGKILSSIYAALALILAFVMGAALQGGSVAEYASIAYGTPSIITAAFVALLTLLVISGGNGRIRDFATIIMPLSTIIYIIMSFWVICVNISRVPEVVLGIIRSAFSLESVAGGVLGFSGSRAIREGFCGGILSNEAGAGTSSFAHTSGKERANAVGGIFEVFFDTSLLCMLTAFSVLLAIPDISSYSSGAELILAAVYPVFDNLGIGLLLALTLAFAISTSVCWYYYGATSYKVVFGKNSSRLYSILYLFFIFVGASVNMTYLVKGSHTVLLFLTVISLFTLMKNSDRIVTLSENMGLITKYESLSEPRKARKASKAARSTASQKASR